MENLVENYKALVIGSSGSIGCALLEELKQDPRCRTAVGVSRHESIAMDITDEASIMAACQQLTPLGPFDVIIVATGILHNERVAPEKKLAHLDLNQMREIFTVNTFGPSLVIKHCQPLLSKNRAVLVCLSAKVGSIEDNRLGGWYSYRASKAALNMMIKTAGIEIRRSNPLCTMVAMHPGTVKSRLSSPFSGDKIGQPAQVAAKKILTALAQIPANRSSIFLSYDGSEIPW